MKKLVISCILFTVLFTSCEPSGKTNTYQINQELLPTELRGMKVYQVCLGDGNYIKIALLPGYETYSYTYPVGKTTNTLSFLLKKDNIIFENDSIWVD